jgi:hypothetical protein
MDNDETTSAPAPASAVPASPQLPEPSQGGSYTRNPDGGLTLVHRTQPNTRARPASDNQAEE